jgi:hypothetical protein
MSAAGRRLVGVAIGAVVVCVLIGLYIGLYLTTSPGDASAAGTTGSNGTNLYLATVAASETTDPHPSWVSYYVVDAHDQHWRHATTFVLPANTLVHMTIYQFDGQSGLRNPFIAQATGIIAIPQMGVSVPLYGIPDSAKNPCNNAPCPLSTDHETITFTFRTPGKGLYRWQCFVPCAAGSIQGFGGPMQTVGYMDGFIKVV